MTILQQQFEQAKLQPQQQHMQQSQVKSNFQDKVQTNLKSTYEYDPIVTSFRCTYCSFESFALNFIKGVKIHIGHMHKCKMCFKLKQYCRCDKKSNFNSL